MAKIVHIALKVDDLDAATKFYEEVFEFRQVATHVKGAHTSRHMTDGRMDLTLMIYQSEDSPEAQLSGAGPCIHHFGIEVDDRAGFSDRIREHGGEILSKPDAKAIKFRTPHGVLAELLDPGTF